jgi:hypothetical protein
MKLIDYDHLSNATLLFLSSTQEYIMYFIFLEVTLGTLDFYQLKYLITVIKTLCVIKIIMECYNSYEVL